ncbi:hypothetical protein MASR1M8_05710 [Thermomonas brevis]
MVILLALVVLAGWWWTGYRQAATVLEASSQSQAGHGSVGAPLLASMRLPEGAHVDPAIRACERALMEAFNSHARDLRLRPDTVSQTAYALAPPFGTPGDAEEWGTDAALRIGELRLAKSRRHLLHAASLAPGDMRIQWLAATQCEGEPGCGQALGSLLAKDPDNMAGWLHELARARTANDEQAALRALHGAANAKYYEPFHRIANTLLIDAYADVPEPAQCRTTEAKASFARVLGEGREFSVLDHVAAMSSLVNMFPSFGGLAQLCGSGDGAPLPKAVRGSCMKVLGRLADAPYLIERAVGLAAMARLTADDKDGATWRERYRQFRWMQQQMSDPKVQALLRPEDYLLEEANTMQAILQAEGRWPPPTDWQPEDERARSRVRAGSPSPRRGG